MQNVAYQQEYTLDTSMPHDKMCQLHSLDWLLTDWGIVLHSAY